ncbi:hypothetical protein AH332_09915 [Salmonella enterica subsp. salamae]|nr:hypothetical protein [Salmonella enterica subsp. salamae]
MEPEYTPERTIHLYHRGLPLALISQDGDISWHAEYDEWGNVLREDNPSQLEQLIRLPGQQYDEESGLHYNRHRYYSPGPGRYITQDPAGLEGGWNPYTYPLNPVTEIDPLGLWAFVIPLVEWTISKAILYFGSAAAGGAVLATSGDSEQSKANTESLTNCPTIPPEDPCDKKLDRGLLKKADIFDAHQVKKDWMGDGARISRFDLCGCKDGRIVIKTKVVGANKNMDCKGEIASPTEYNWK